MAAIANDRPLDECVNNLMQISLTKGQLTTTGGERSAGGCSYNLAMRNNYLSQRRADSQSGFSLIEVLISIVILSFGLLGLVGLQAAALQGNRDARLQSTAVLLARELAEMMRSNKDVALTATNPYLGDFNTDPMVAASPSYCLNVGSLPTACSSNTAIANAQMTEWLARVNSELPGARVAVCVDKAPYDTAGKPRWACDNTGTGPIAVIKIGWTRSSTKRSADLADAFERATVPSLVLPITAGNVL